jgi:hypothetical protein
VAHRDIMVIGASAGGLEALKQILGTIPADVDASILIVLHTASHARSVLAKVLERASQLPVSHPHDWGADRAWPSLYCAAQLSPDHYRRGHYARAPGSARESPQAGD